VSGEASVETEVVIRPYRDDDASEVLDLLVGSLGGGPAGERPPEYFQWKHLDNPFGRSYMIVAEFAGRIIGFRALMRWQFGIGDRTVEAVRPVDTVTHPDHRGRGVFSRLTRAALESLQGEIDLVFNTPNQNSLPGYLKLGWEVVGQVPVSVRVCRPASFVLGKLRRSGSASPPERPAISAPRASEVLEGDTEVAGLLERVERVPGAYATPRTVPFLRWRFGDAPLLGYHAVVERDGDGLRGLAFFRLRAEGSLWGLSVADVLVRDGDVSVARSLLAAARRSANVAYVAAAFPPGSSAAAAHRGPTTMRAPRGMTFAVNPVRPDLRPDPRVLSSWALSTGDVEVF
jgi:GNAT superfamily N-acetyltransferase